MNGSHQLKTIWLLIGLLLAFNTACPGDDDADVVDTTITEDGDSIVDTTEPVDDVEFDTAADDSTALDTVAFIDTSDLDTTDGGLQDVPVDTSGVVDTTSTSVCTADDDCGTIETPYCDQLVGHCVQCVVETDCGWSGRCIDGSCAPAQRAR